MLYTGADPENFRGVAKKSGGGVDFGCIEVKPWAFAIYEFEKL